MSTFKIALISHEFPPYMFGGISSNCFDLAYALSKKGISTTVFSGRSEKITIERPNKHLKVIRMPFFDYPPRFIWFQLQNFKGFTRLLKDYTIIHGVNPLSSALYSLVKKKLNKPFVTSIHEVYSRDLKVFVNSPFSEWSVWDFSLHVAGYPLNEFLTRMCLKASDHIVVCGFSAFKDLITEYQNLDSHRISVIYNGINFDKVDAIKGNAGKNPSIIFFGRLIWRKGILHLLKAMLNINKRFPDLILQIFGKGPLEKVIRRFSSKFGMINQIFIQGYVPYSTLIRNIKSSTIVVLPSLYEVGPFIAALEAMACKKPVVAFDLPFNREFISNNFTGILAKPGDISDLAEKICVLLTDDALRTRIAKNAYDYVKTHHNWEKLVDEYITIYQSLAQ
ncbi:MAG: glycosyltransferase family 4 protein [Candidatus Heimdallarchaeaceae archaeon]